MDRISGSYGTRLAVRPLSGYCVNFTSKIVKCKWMIWDRLDWQIAKEGYSGRDDGDGRAGAQGGRVISRAPKRTSRGVCEVSVCASTAVQAIEKEVWLRDIKMCWLYVTTSADRCPGSGKCRYENTQNPNSQQPSWDHQVWLSFRPSPESNRQFRIGVRHNIATYSSNTH